MYILYICIYINKNASPHKIISGEVSISMYYLLDMEDHQLLVYVYIISIYI